MNVKRKIPAGLLAVAFLAGAAQAAEPTHAPARWRSKMQELSKVLTELLVDVSSDRRFNDPANRGRIVAYAAKLSELAREVKAQGTSPLDQDPTLKLIESGFHDEADRAYAALRSGHHEYARSVIAGISSYCIACHTRNDSGPAFTGPALPSAALKLDPLERGKFLAATRNFDLALAEFSKLLGDREAARERPLDSVRATRYALAIAVRVKKDPNRALTLLGQVLANPDAPYFLKQDAALWKVELEKWKAELPKQPTTEEGLFSEALRLTSAAHEQQKFPADRSADVLYLRASAALHDLLQKAPDGRHAAEAFLMAGMSYEVLRDLSLDDLHETYYEACIRKVPGSETAKLCFKRYEQSVIEGFTGSAGTDLPAEVEEHLSELKKLATGSAGPAL